MSDFLTRLAERAMGVAPRVRPKLPRRFAAPPVDADPDLRWWREALESRARPAEPADSAPDDSPPPPAAAAPVEEVP